MNDTAACLELTKGAGGALGYFGKDIDASRKMTAPGSTKTTGRPRLRCG